MHLIERQKQWAALPSSTIIHPVVTFISNRLELGAGTVLAECGTGEFAGQEARLLALLSAAYQRAFDPHVLVKIRCACQEWHEGHHALARVHLALAGLSSLPYPTEAAYRLFIADGLIAHGMKPSDILRALNIGTTAVANFEKYNPGELRIPKGQHGGGRWTDANDADLAVPSLASLNTPPGISPPRRSEPALVEEPDCRQVWQQCHELCWDDAGVDFGSHRRCVRECMARSGCHNF